ncbi:carbohydrate-binding protein [Labedaea rhizosphaerae]|uniref:Uncharacterized protein n=1 Tax=Labedaea rhizosphaerae TaxID=598644 RepID=A0A4R6SEZ5_LABRH|nr:carbohydrate-binding protein [Labedaea rhizosphaerae]TDQ00243.1 hypothetical protein EV186_102104 [Labedaea rhizosphaerae]
MRSLLVALSIAAGLTIPVTAASAQQATHSEVVGAKPGTTATAAADRFRELRSHRAPAIKASIHDDWGTYTSGAAVTGQDAVQSVYSDLSVSGDTLYAPTMKAPGSCVELVTTYTGGVRQVWAWDWCVSVNVARSVTIDGTFRANYVTSVNGHDSYHGRVEQTDASRNTWTAWLFNYRTGQWDTFYTQSGTDQSRDGRSWNIFEIYASGDTTAQYCTALGSRVIESSSYRIRLNGAWTAAGTGNTSVLSNSSSNNFLCPGLTRTVVHPNDDWQVHR